ncbi:MAG: NAD(P)H-dependent oxidoreductase [Clostridia bacterium]|nr:NAD(P)H-dependent oxidoreductase [Clostridia bacterium]
MKLLFIDACQRGEKISRTSSLARAFLEAFREASPSSSVSAVALRDMDLRPFKGSDVERREALIDDGKLNHPMFELANQFAAANRILVAAPYWDYMFPAALKTYIEHIMVRNINFYYNEKGPVGLCRADRLAYLTTAGSPMACNDWGSAYLRAICSMVGIERFDAISAEGLDVEGWDVEGEMKKAREKARALGSSFALD